MQIYFLTLLFILQHFSKSGLHLIPKCSRNIQNLEQIKNPSVLNDSTDKHLRILNKNPISSSLHGTGSDAVPWFWLVRISFWQDVHSSPALWGEQPTFFVFSGSDLWHSGRVWGVGLTRAGRSRGLPCWCRRPDPWPGPAATGPSWCWRGVSGPEPWGKPR